MAFSTKTTDDATVLRYSFIYALKQAQKKLIQENFAHW